MSQRLPDHVLCDCLPCPNCLYLSPIVFSSLLYLHPPLALVLTHVFVASHLSTELKPSDLSHTLGSESFCVQVL